MRRINKGQAVQDFVNFANNNPGASWSDLHSNAHQTYLDSRDQIIMVEQDCLCGYTELPVKEFNDFHLDHYRKRSLFQNLTFDWNNLIAAHNDGEFGAKYKDNRYRIQLSDYTLIFDPVLENVQDHFYYNENGEIEPMNGADSVNKNKVIKTREVFNLNHQSLRRRRRSIIKQISDCKKSDLSNVDILDIFKSSGFKSLINQYI